MGFPKPSRGPRGYWCPACRRWHLRNSRLGHMHKPYVDAEREQRRRDRAEREEARRARQERPRADVPRRDPSHDRPGT